MVSSHYTLLMQILRFFPSQWFILTRCIYLSSLFILHPGWSVPHSVWCCRTVFAGRGADQTSEPCVLHAWRCASEDRPSTRLAELSWKIQRGRCIPLQPCAASPVLNLGNQQSVESTEYCCHLQLIVAPFRRNRIWEIWLLRGCFCIVLLFLCLYVCTVCAMTFMSDFDLCFLNIMGFVAFTVHVKT